jgi:tetratricopeptide (TPR) repeat protein
MATKSVSTKTAQQWTFRSRLRRGAFGWRGSRPAIARIDEALVEICAVARKDPVLGAEGAVLFLEKISPAVRDVDSSSGALGSAAYWAVDALVPIIAAAPVSDAVRARWLERLFEAIEEDDPPYLESLGDHWGGLCVTVALASHWADHLLPSLRQVAEDGRRGVFAWFKGTSICYSALFHAGRHEELLALLAADPHPIWPYLIWGGRVLAARREVDEAIAYLQRRAGTNTPEGALARFAEDVLLQAGRRAEAYACHAIAANQANSRLATYRAIAKKYPEIAPDRLLRDLIGSTPGDEGKWFATAKSQKRLDLALELAWQSPCDPKTLTRAARDHLSSQPVFAVEAALAALHWMSLGHGYELTGSDVRQAYDYAMESAQSVGQLETIQRRVDQMLAGNGPAAKWMRQVLGLGDR